MNKIVLPFILFFTILLLDSSFAHPTSADSPTVSVKLKNYLGNQKEIKIDLVGNHKVIVGSTSEDTANTTYVLRLENGLLNLYSNNKKIASSNTLLTITPTEYGTTNHLKINGRAYLGEMLFTIENSFIRPVNKLPLEDYLKGVVPYEMPASWNVEALKAQTVAARTYALSKINNIIDDTVTFQVYGGYIWNSSLYNNSNKAVEQTTGEVLRYTGKLISAVYSSSNGGHTESNSNYWGTPQVPYLIGESDPYDPQTGWDITIEKQQMNLSELDLTNPDKWWSSTFEKQVNSSPIVNIRSYIINNYHPKTNVKIIGLPTIQVTGKNSSGKSTKGTILVDYYVKNADGTFKRENADSLPSNYSTTLSGQTRYETSIEIAKNGWSTSSSVILGRGDLPVDALAGSVLANKYSSPLLLTPSSELPKNILTQINELGAKKVYILGGHAAISKNVENILTTQGITVQRITGSTRYETSVNIAKSIGVSTQLIITSGSDTSPDALSIASYAADKQIPILLTAQKQLSNEVKQYIKTQAPSKVYIIGGISAVSSSIESELSSLGIKAVERISGPDRYETSIAIAKKFQFDLSNVFFARGDIFIDALPGAVLAAKKKSPVILTQVNSFPSKSQDWLKSAGVRPNVYYLGGKSAISDNAKNEIKQSLLGDIKKHTLKRENIDIGIMRAMFGGSIFKSYHIDSVLEKNGKFIINGKGYGHGVGMSQYGAKARGDDGIMYQDILEFYYPGAILGY